MLENSGGPAAQPRAGQRPPPRPLSSGWHWVFASCVLGLGISVTGWSLRSQVAATTFSLVTLANKLLAIVANQIVFRDTSALGTAALCAAIGSSFFFRDGAGSTAPNQAAVAAGNGGAQGGGGEDGALAAVADGAEAAQAPDGAAPAGEREGAGQ